jgi:hypothetical protein
MHTKISILIRERRGRSGRQTPRKPREDKDTAWSDGAQVSDNSGHQKLGETRFSPGVFAGHIALITP